jgi:hypothetical protein
MRALAQLPLAALLLAGCETLFIGTPPSGRYELAAVNGRAVPLVGGALASPASPSGTCQNIRQSGHLTLDSISRRFLHGPSPARDPCERQLPANWRPPHIGDHGARRRHPPLARF